VFAGTRVPIKSLFDYLEAGESLDEFLRQFPSPVRVRGRDYHINGSQSRVLATGADTARLFND
jgi:hypothetical protein